MVTTPDEFGTAWKVAGSDTCSDGCGSSCQQCTNELHARAQCEVIQAADGPLRFCHEHVDPARYFKSCVFDVCVLGDDFLCGAIQTYVSACQSANGRIYPWRQNTTCRPECPANSHYELCGSDCGHTCASSMNASCGQVCSEGCFCDEGFVRSGTGCVPVESCGCEHDGSYYKDGESFWTEGCSQQCECHAPNDLRCSAASCTPAQECAIRDCRLGCFLYNLTTCTVWGDPHYITFDHKAYDFQGTGKTCGLCGNFNGNPDDEFRIPSGMMVTTPDEFGTAWKVAGSDTCSDGCGSSCQQCTNELHARAQCEVIQAADGPLRFCHEHVDPARYFKSCVFDVCVLGDDFLCGAIQTYVSACQSANGRIYPWRQNTTCRPECPANSHYELCGSDCGHTCASSMNASCGQVCSEGCFCDEGFVRSGTGCVPVESCGCEHDGSYYKDGESFWTEGCSQRCECHAPNDLRCSAASCTPAQECAIRDGRLGCFLYDLTTCTVWGDPHYITFDGALAHFQGTCSYIISESVSHGTNETQFQVIATNNHRGNNRVSFVSTVDVYLSNQPETVNIRIGPNKRITVNGSEVSLPTTAGTLAQVGRQGSYIVVDAIHFIVQFDGWSTLLVRLDRNHQNRVTGMCGNFNNDPGDDKVLPNGTLAQNDNDFGHSWKAPTSKPGCGSTDDESGDGTNDCPFMEEYSELCSVITNTSGPFSACHLHSDPQPFFSSCVYDLCLYTTANGMLCSAVSAYERTCSVLGLNISEWRSALQCDESDPCEQLNCTEYEWCGERDGVYGCYCDEHYSRPNSESYDSFITCVSSSGTLSLSRCQLFEAGFHPTALHLRDGSCKGTLQDGRLVFNFNNDDQLCGTVLRSNGTHFIYENSIQSNEDTDIELVFCCEYPLTQALSMDLGINPVESIVKKKLTSGQGHYHLRIIPYQDAGFLVPLTGKRNIEMEIDQRLYVEVRAEGVDERQISTILDSCWATPVNIAGYPVRLDLIKNKCPNSEDGSVELVQNGISTVAQFSFRIFTFTNFPSIYLHCQVHLCLLSRSNCAAYCNPGHHRVYRDVYYHDSITLSLGPLIAMQSTNSKRMMNPAG
ncbi:IgGFc-binding protein-like [Dicentrarchus labrax]|uniref:IgGFc-binding protein-like n=1 Tax=Dicentrarchus labrax TaxID=13489 RepID=UPI0021F61A04|nr:IgGFc-binding protein-like [Dicentrarchus labrax]